VSELQPGDRVVVTGAAGFIGSAITRALAARGAHVVAVVEPGTESAASEVLGPIASEVAVADIAAPGAMDPIVVGARYCFHVAALYSFWPRDPAPYYRTNVEGSTNVVRAAWRAGVERICYTSSVATIGLQATQRGECATEADYAYVEHLFGNYKRSKYVAEHEVLRLGAQGAPVVLAHPTFPVGPGDRRPTPTGKLVVDFLNGRFPAYVDTTLNVVHVDDLAAGHLLTLERGGAGQSYVLGGENVSMQSLLGELASISGLAAPTHRVPTAVTLLAAHASDAVEARLLRREPHVPLEGARMSATHMRFDDAKARRELGYTTRPTSEALADAIKFFCASGYVSDKRMAMMTRDAATVAAAST
jgi:dihydroflavonol-4-reductase